MSYYIFGMIVRRADLNEIEEESLEWKIVERGIDHHIYVRLRANIYITEIMDMLWKSDLTYGPHIDFLITASPLDNTSDGFVRPHEVGDDHVNMIQTKLRSISNWIESIIDHIDAKKIYVYVTDTFDVSYEKVQANTGDIYEVLKSQIDVSGEISPFVMEVE
jgi:hypothetical protein